MISINDSILDSIKKLLGMDPSYTAFDQDVIMHINSAFAILNQLGVGPAGGYEISSKDNKWSEFLSSERKLNATRSYIYQKVRLLFDPPQNAFLVTAIEKLISEFEFRLLVAADEVRDD